MDWLVDLFSNGSIAHAILVLSLGVGLGMALGEVRLRGMRLGIGGVLFVSLALGQAGLTIDDRTLEFVREFGLVLFVYAIGLQIGPGFFSSLRRQGLRLNALALLIVAMGTGIAVLISVFSGIRFPATVGMLCGAVTNTPGLGAAQQAFKEVAASSPEALRLVGLGYAMAYPLGLFGILFTMNLVRRAFRIDVAAEAREFEKLQAVGVRPIVIRNVEVTNPNLAGKTVDELLDLTGEGAVVTRVYHGGQQALATPTAHLEVGDVLHVVGTETQVERFIIIVGRASSLELTAMPSTISVRRVVVTRREVVGQRLGDLAIDERYGVIITRVVRAGVEFSATHDMKVQFGDRLILVGVEQALDRAEGVIGNRVRELEQANVVSVFFGIALGMIVGAIPFALPGLPIPLRLGAAGGPLLVAMALGRYGKVGPFLSYMPNSAKRFLADFGIALFLASIGIRSGGQFAQTLIEGNGLYWMGLAALITFVPLVSVAFLARGWLKMNFVSICGVITGGMTNSAGLAYASDLVGEDSPSISYATVYPLSFLLRVAIVQLFVLIGSG